MTAGRLAHAGGDSLDGTVLVWNGVVARVPALVVQPTSVHEIAATVAFAQDHGLMLDIEGGGRNAAATSLAERAVTLDLSRMRTITFDPDAGLVHVRPGCSPRDVERATLERGRVPGFTSPGGVAQELPDASLGYLAYRYGWTAGDLEEAEIVTADGAVRIANRHENVRLFREIRSGAGGVGVISRLSLRAAPRKHMSAEKAHVR